jgi:hypothetical protein
MLILSAGILELDGPSGYCLVKSEELRGSMLLVGDFITADLR